MRKTILFAVICVLFCFFPILEGAASSTNFVSSLKAKWSEHDITNLLAFVENSVATNPCVETVTAQAIVYGSVLSWGTEATNLLQQAYFNHCANDHSYSGADKLCISNCLDHLSRSYVQFAALGGGALSDSPKTNLVYISELFLASPEAPLFHDVLEQISSYGE